MSYRWYERSSVVRQKASIFLEPYSSLNSQRKIDHRLGLDSSSDEDVDLSHNNQSSFAFPKNNTEIVQNLDDNTLIENIQNDNDDEENEIDDVVSIQNDDIEENEIDDTNYDNEIDFLENTDFDWDQESIHICDVVGSNTAEILEHRICTNWPQQLIDNIIDNGTDIPLGTTASIQHCLKHWASKLNVWEWTQQENPMTHELPDQLDAKACEETISNLQQLNDTGKNIVTQVVKEMIVNDPLLTMMISHTMSERLIDFANNNSINDHNNDDEDDDDDVDAQIMADNGALTRDEWTLKNYQYKTKESKKNTDPTVSPDNLWYPTGSQFWMEMYWHFVNGNIDFATMELIIKQFHHKPTLQLYGDIDSLQWCPRNPAHLHSMFKTQCMINSIQTITSTVQAPTNNSGSHINKKETYTWAYDPFSKDFEMYLKIPMHRKALLAPLDAYYNIYKHNPIHIPQRKRKQRPLGKLHLLQCRISHYGFWRCLEKVVFVLNPKAKPNELWDTMLMVPGTFVKLPINNDNHNEFGLITDVIGLHWTLRLYRNPDETNFIDWSTRLLEKLQHFADKEDSVENCNMYPEYSLEYLPLTWKYGNCPQPLRHCHFKHSNQRQLWCSIDNNEKWYETQVQTINVSDDIEILSLSINNHLIFPDPNALNETDIIDKQTIWEWNVTVMNNQAYTTISLDIVRQFLMCLKDPYYYIWAGRVDPESTEMVVIPLQMNSDGFEYMRMSNTKHSWKSMKENYIAPLNHLLSKRLICSFGVCLSGCNNLPFYKMFAKECILMMFKGIKVELTCGRVINVLLPLMSILNDSAEFKYVTGIIGSSGARNDYFTVLNNQTNLLTDFVTQPERHYRVLLGQQHINYIHANAPSIIALVSAARISLNENSRRRYHGPVGHYVTDVLQHLFRQAGISPTRKPGLPYINCLSLTHVEFAHNVFNHILPRMCAAIKESFYHWTNPTNQDILEDVWKRLTNCKYRPSGNNKSNLRNSTEGTKVTLKSVVIYRSAFELAINGQALGFRFDELFILQQMITWIGCWFCDTNDDVRIRQLINQCFNICMQVANVQTLVDKFAKSSALRNWRNLMSVCVYWVDQLQLYFGLMYEGVNKMTKNKLPTSASNNQTTMIQQHVAKNRYIKDMQFQAMGYRKVDGLGHGIQQIVKQDKKHSSLIQKSMYYEIVPSSQDIAIINNHDHWNNFIYFTKPRHITNKKWKSHLNHKNSNSNKYPKYLTQLGLPIISKLLLQWLHCVVADEMYSHLIAQMYHLLMQCLIDQSIHVYNIKAVSTFYRSFQDSVCRATDMIWLRDDNQDSILSINRIIRIKGFDTIKTDPKFANIWNENWTTHWDDIIMLGGHIWRLEPGTSTNINLELYSLNNTPTIINTNTVRCFSVEFIVQQLYIQHHHIIPTKEDQNVLHESVRMWPHGDSSHWPDSRNVDIASSCDGSQLPYCGVGWFCGNENHRQANCTQCDQIRYAMRSKLKSQCREDLHPVYRPYSIYQGFIPRLFGCKRINELGW